MSSWDLGNLAYLGLLGSVLIVWMIVSNRQSLGRTLQQAMGWALIFLGVIAIVGLWDDIRRTAMPGRAAVATDGRIEATRAPDGHFYLTLLVNDAPVNFMVDTGASAVVLSAKDARKAGIDLTDLAYAGRANTANGMVRTAAVQLKQIGLGPVSDHNVRAWVTQGEMEQSLLGMSYLERWGRIEITGRSLVLER